MMVLWLCMAVSVQITWMSFSKSEPAAPEVNVITSTAQSVSFEIVIPGIYTQDTIVNGVSFTRLILPQIHELILDNLPNNNAVFSLYPYKIHP